MSFPAGGNVQVYHNEDGEPLGWDYIVDDEPYGLLDDLWTGPSDENRLWGDEAACRAEGAHGQDSSVTGKDGRWLCDWCGEDCTEEVENCGYDYN